MTGSKRRKILALVGVVCVLASGWVLYSVFAAQARPGAALAQAPLNTQVQIPPAFIMAVDDSGSMTFHNQFPASDGYGCWSGTSFFSAPGVLRTSGTCSFAYSYIGPRAGFLGIPPVDTYGFARSPDFNPSYFDPEVVYQPWLRADGQPYGATTANPSGNASVTATRLDPRNASPTLALASDFAEVQDRSRFNTRSGMVLPAGTRYRLDGNNFAFCGRLYNGGTSAWQTVGSGGITVNGNCVIYISYWPATFYLREQRNNTAPTIQASGYSGITPVRITNACGTGCHLWRYRIEARHTEALQNFANWFSFYGNRNRAMVAGMTRSMVTVNNMRVGYFTINSHASYANPVTNASQRVAMRDMANDTDRAALWNSMLALPASGGTPNRQAVYSAGQQFRRTDGTGAPVQLACQRNAVMLFTDGFSNNNGPAVGNVDGGMGQPFRDGYDDTLADIATSYYLNTTGGASPIRPDLQPGLVPRPSACPSSDPKINCQNNLHVNFYGVTLGGRGNLYDPDAPADPYTTPAVYQNWPSRQNDNRSTVDDIWHATVNTRGELINARTPADIVDAMRRILANVAAGSSPSGALAMSGARISEGSLSVVPEYEVGNEGTDWSGLLTASRVRINASTGNPQDVFLWEASAQLGSNESAADARSARVFFAKGNVVRPFQAANVTLADLCTKSTALYPAMSRCSASQLQQLGATPAIAVRYLMGDRSRERAQASGFLRDRTTLLGDIVTSSPVVSAPGDDYGYRTLPGAIGTSYATYLRNKASRHYMVYVGANDGMLHGFHGGLNADGNLAGTGGRELFGYIPATSLGHLGNLLLPYDPADGSDQRFDHRYYVDGPITVSDACTGACTAVGDWRTLLVGSAGAGGRSVFGLNVTNPSAFAASSRLWEINDLDDTLTPAIRRNIGFVLGAPVIVPVRIGNRVTWRAIFGNGYNSASGRAVLFVVDLSGDFSNSRVRMIEAVEAGAPAGPNGLGNIVVTDRRHSGGSSWIRDGFADTVYAADQKGAIWKFDLLNESASSVTTPLFTTREHQEDGTTYRQPILGGMTAAAGANGGVMLYFGTGSFSFVGDPQDASLQSLYAVNDTVRGAISSTLTRSSLRGQSVSSSNGTRTLNVDSSGAGLSSGWYVDLPAGERFVGNPRIAAGVVFMPTYAPQLERTGCSTSGLNWLFALNARSGSAGFDGGRSGSPDGDVYASGVAAVALDTQGTAPVRDVGVNVVPRLSPAEPGPSDPLGADPPSPPEQGCWMRVTVAGLSEAIFLPYPCGRQSWRQLQ